MVLDVHAAGEHALDVGRRGTVTQPGHEVSGFLHLELALEQVGVGLVPDRYEQARYREQVSSSVSTLRTVIAASFGVALDAVDDVVPQEPDLLVGERTFHCMIFDARSWSRRWTIVTDRANLVRKMASSRAESPPPTTAMSSPRKKKPSQVAHVDTPHGPPARSRGQGCSMRTGRPRGDDQCVGLVGGLGGIGITHPDAERAGGQVGAGDPLRADVGAERAACSRKRIMSSGPMIPSGKPG